MPQVPDGIMSVTVVAEYPDGIAGDQIPEEATIIAVADAYDAMTSRRSYRDVMCCPRIRCVLKSKKE